MRWLAFFILAYIMLGLDAGLARAIEWHGFTPDFVLLAAVFIAINASHDTALLACFVLGALHDLLGAGTLGLLAFSYGAAGLFVVAAHHAVNRKNPAAQFLLTAMAGIIIAVILVFHGWIRPPAIEEKSIAVHLPMATLFGSAIYSAVLAPLVLPVLQRMNRVFRFQRKGRI